MGDGVDVLAFILFLRMSAAGLSFEAGPLAGGGEGRRIDNRAWVILCSRPLSLPRVAYGAAQGDSYPASWKFRDQTGPEEQGTDRDAFARWWCGRTRRKRGKQISKMMLYIITRRALPRRAHVRGCSANAGIFFKDAKRSYAYYA